MEQSKVNFDAQYTPVVSELGDWWDDNVVYSKFSRQGIDIVCATFPQPKHVKPLANVIISNGWSDTFLRYAEITKNLYEYGFNIYMYDHQSQGLSGRWLSETQSIWISSFEDYVDDFICFVTSITRESNLPIYLIGYCMGGLISSIAMSRLPSLVSRAVLISPMFRNKCGIKSFKFSFPIPQPLTRWLAMLACQAGMGTIHSFGFFKEKPTDPLDLNVITSDIEQLSIWQSLRQRYPEIIASCVTNNWIYQAIQAQRRFAHRYEFVRTNTLIIAAEKDFIVHNRAMLLFQRKAVASRVFLCKKGYHDLLHENESIRGAIKKAILDFFIHNSNNVYLVDAAYPLIACPKNTRLYSMTETIIRSVGLVVAGVTCIIGVTLIFGPNPRK